MPAGRTRNLLGDYRKTILSTHKKVTKEYLEDFLKRTKIPNVRHALFRAKKYGHCYLSRSLWGCHKALEINYTKEFQLYEINYKGFREDDYGYYNEKIFEYHFYLSEQS